MGKADRIGDISFCTIPPEGWECTRKEGHAGPCAAVPFSTVEAEIARLTVEDEARIEAAWQKHKRAAPNPPAEPHRTLRDEYAMAALTALITAPKQSWSNYPKEAAERSYEIADAMLAARTGAA